MQEREQSRKLTEGFSCEIAFKNVSFSYEGRPSTVLHDISFKVRAGEHVAFVGPSGCGKSTIMALLLRFYEPNEGKILSGGIDIKDFDLKYLRRQFGVVGQEPTVFNASFSENIRYNHLNATEEDIIDASRKANALNFI
jgi:ATP-binding cassette subfamily B (MDR/TAP) protein 1